MKFPLTNNPDVDNLIYDFVYYIEEQLINKYREIHKKKFADTLSEICKINLIYRIYSMCGRGTYPRQQQQQQEDCNKSKLKYKNIKYFNYRKKYKNLRKIHKSVGGKCVRFKYS